MRQGAPLGATGTNIMRRGRMRLLSSKILFQYIINDSYFG